MSLFKNKRCLVLVSGEGGHFSQLSRLNAFISENSQFAKVVITDNVNDSNQIPACDFLFEIGAARNKSGFSFVVLFIHLFKVLKMSFQLLKLRPSLLISTGPGVVIFPALISKLLGSRVLHIETWSRFYSKSLTGKIMYYVADEFWVQNKSLQNVYPKSKYCGRL